LNSLGIRTRTHGHSERDAPQPLAHRPVRLYPLRDREHGALLERGKRRAQHDGPGRGARRHLLGPLHGGGAGGGPGGQDRPPIRPHPCGRAAHRTGLQHPAAGRQAPAPCPNVPVGRGDRVSAPQAG